MVTNNNNIQRLVTRECGHLEIFDVVYDTAPVIAGITGIEICASMRVTQCRVCENRPNCILGEAGIAFNESYLASKPKDTILVINTLLRLDHVPCDPAFAG